MPNGSLICSLPEWLGTLSCVWRPESESLPTMDTIFMSEKGWYSRALSLIRTERSVKLVVEGRHARVLTKHLPMMAKPGDGFTFRNVFNMARFARLHRLYFSALNHGLGVSMEPDGERLVLRMNDRIRGVPAGPTVVILREARGV